MRPQDVDGAKILHNLGNCGLDCGEVRYIALVRAGIYPKDFKNIAGFLSFLKVSYIDKGYVGMVLCHLLGNSEADSSGTTCNYRYFSFKHF